jgi:hypothetical protein
MVSGKKVTGKRGHRYGSPTEGVKDKEEEEEEEEEE